MEKRKNNCRAICVGDQVFYVNSEREIDEYFISKIGNGTVTIEWKGNNSIMKIAKTIPIPELMESKRLFLSRMDAILLKEKLDDEYQKRQDAYEEQLLECALQEITLEEVLQHGKLLRTKKTEYECTYGAGGEWREAYLFAYAGKQYIVLYQYSNFPFITRRCIGFRSV